MSGLEFSEIPLCPPDVVFGVLDSFNQDPDPNKVNLSIGAYRTDEGDPWVLPIVKATELALAQDVLQDHEYLPISGLTAFLDSSARLVLGASSTIILENRYAAVQTIGGTGAIRIGLGFLKKFSKSNVFYLPTPTWPNHNKILTELGAEIRSYRYYDVDKNCLDEKGMIEDLRAAPEGSTVILHGVAHNPTGMDPTKDQWKQICDVIKERSLTTFVDFAYQGFASGDLDKDAWAVRYFIEQGLNLFIAQSYSKNFGLYNERVGCLTVTCSSPKLASCVKSQLAVLCRTIWSNPSNHGARIVATVLNNPAMFAEWKENLRVMSDRLSQMRQALYDRLRVLGTPGNWDHLLAQIGMFSYTGLKPNQVEIMTKKFHIYLMKSGRISLAGLNSKNLDYVAKGIHEVITTT
ncbi:Aspartate aminotransferase, cytoplasmic-like [Oopsacas minuta]|uniref:Aspartate aminotransferase n=1 Tax=Oopsacas minuta TaxID=111878 RepID=A0AAV7K9J1_9METZ|nr:Aspartate aminotransferase, cytoplasmic-like [Oopsacas minuta]